MKNFKEWLFIILFILIALTSIILYIFYIENIVTADIPWWMKLALLKGK